LVDVIVQSFDFSLAVLIYSHMLA